MTKELKLLLEELEVYTAATSTGKEDNIAVWSDVNFFAAGGYDGGDGIEIVQFTKNSPYILRIRVYKRYRYEESEVLYFTFENEKKLVDFLEENYR